MVPSSQVFLRVFKLLFIVILPVSFLRAWEYPVKNLKITSLFGESRKDHFHNGVDFANEQLVYPIEEGEMIFYREEDPLSGFIGIGNHIVVEHENGIRSYYYHLADNTLEKEVFKVSKESSLATMGNTGKSFGSHLHLTIVDYQSRRVLNPQLLLPPQPDTVKPVIGSLFFTVKQNPLTFKIKNRTVIDYKNSIKLYLTAGDVKTYYPSRILTPLNAWGLRRITFRIDEGVLRNYDFDYLIQSGNRLLLKSGQDFFETYGLEFNYVLGDFFPTRSSYQFYIEIEDWQGNQDAEKYYVIFRL